MRPLLVVLAAWVVWAGCGAPDLTEPPDDADRFPEVVDVVVEKSSDGTYTFDVTISSPYDSPERYADAWRVRAADGTVYGVRELLHDHASEQPFTRSLSGVTIPDGVEIVLVEGRDLEHGWGGETMTVDLP